MKNLIDKFENFGLQHNFLKQKARILIGLSGGADSMALTLLFMEIQAKYALFLAVAHVNYNLRGEESKQDEIFVKEFCFKHNMPLYILKAKIQGEVGIQNEAREIRLEYFRKLKKHYKLDFIALGHHYEDQTETVLHRFIRGSGLTGLSGITPIKNDIIHPLLLFKKEMLIEYLKFKGISYRTDQTNFSNHYTRNKIRNELIPLIKQEFNPNFEKKMIDYGNLFYLSDKYFQQQSKKDYKKAIICENENIIVFDVGVLKKNFPILVFYIFREAYGLLTKKNMDFYTVHFLDIMSLLESESGYKEVFLPENIKVEKDYEFLVFKKLDNYHDPAKESERVLNKIRDVFVFNEYRFEMKKTKHNPLIESNSVLPLSPEQKMIKSKMPSIYTSYPFPNSFAVFDLDKIYFPITLRFRKAGDKFMPFGMNSYKKVKNFFIDEKVPLKERANIVIFSDAEKIIWLSGYRIDQRVAVSNETKNFLSVKIERCEDIKNRVAMRIKSVEI
ncbi:MAG: tRNA lysidine(34) synthetase TilS [Candidatus Cloacimonetes bacterium]|nr:tRNA lysidine(34) synthetase TilS [Candidatus Cloacimonadota bacterium]